LVKIRLKRMGAKKHPVYRLVVAESTSPRDGRFIETIGFYNPGVEPREVRIEEERARYWLSVGAQPTETAANLLVSKGVEVKGYKPYTPSATTTATAATATTEA
jgi:small subunit ribosomal protein S16